MFFDCYFKSPISSDVAWFPARFALEVPNVFGGLNFKGRNAQED